jgi:hypothetical protein
MNEEFDEAPVNLSALNLDTEWRAKRIAARVSSRIERVGAEPAAVNGIEIVLARWAIPVSLAAAASLAFVLLTRARHEGEAFAALVLPRGPAAAWVASGQVPEVTEVTTMIGGRQ